MKYFSMSLTRANPFIESDEDYPAGEDQKKEKGIPLPEYVNLSFARNFPQRKYDDKEKFNDFINRVYRLHFELNINLATALDHVNDTDRAIANLNIRTVAELIKKRPPKKGPAAEHYKENKKDFSYSNIIDNIAAHYEEFYLEYLKDNISDKQNVDIPKE